MSQRGDDNKINVRLEDGQISLRDWFAGQAMQARLTGTNMARLDIRHAIAADAYAIADAMLSARSNRGEEDNG